MSVQNIIEEAVGKNPLGLKEAFHEEIRSRIAFALEAKMDEAEQIDEVSKKTLGSYVTKAAMSSTLAGNTMGASKSDADKQKAAKTIGKRMQGIHRASNRLSK